MNYSNKSLGGGGPLPGQTYTDATLVGYSTIMDGEVLIIPGDDHSLIYKSGARGQFLIRSYEDAVLFQVDDTEVLKIRDVYEDRTLVAPRIYGEFSYVSAGVGVSVSLEGRAEAGRISAEADGLGDIHIVTVFLPTLPLGRTHAVIALTPEGNVYNLSAVYDSMSNSFAIYGNTGGGALSFTYIITSF